MMEEVNWPENAAEWREVIDSGLALTGDSGRKLLESGEFPYKRLENWVRMSFTADVGETFVEAVARNIRGLVHWAYGDGTEPRWSGSDSDNPQL